MPNSIDDDVSNIRASRYFIAQATGICARCDRPSRLLALALPPGHEVLELADDTPSEPGAADTWATVNHPALLFHVAHLSENVRSQLCGISPAYRKAFVEPGVDSCWANHCDHCGAAFDDQDLCCEPGGAFLPVSEADAGRIQLSTVEEPLAADAAGYAQEPDFFAAMRRT